MERTDALQRQELSAQTALDAAIAALGNGRQLSVTPCSGRTRQR
jgi:hypothetical protein